MKLLPYSNGLRKVSMKKNRTPKEVAKLILIIVGIFLLVGFVYQKISNFIAKETLRQGVDYTTVDDRRMDFRLEGEGNYTVVFDGDIGGNLEQWTPVVDELSDDNVSTFVYNRRGYGYSDSGSERTPEEQAQDLKILLRKAGAPEPYILVGEGYGSLVLTSFAEQFKDSVAGVMLINPLDESYIGTKDYNKKQIITKLRRKIEKVGSNFGLTELLDKLNLDVSLDDFESSLSGEELDEFKTQRTKTKYTTAVYNEMNVLSKGLSDSQKVGVFTGMPYYLMTSFDNDNLKNLGDESLTKVYKTETTSTFSGLNNTENVVNGIRYIVKELKSK
ncbi:alpha/beta hydrolase [Clostridium saudiense]|nr:alpha/beta hydrolase [Clostridium saudiense]